MANIKGEQPLTLVKAHLFPITISSWLKILPISIHLSSGSDALLNSKQQDM